MRERRYAWLALLVVAAAAVVRLAAAANEFWLDEVWSLRIAIDLGSAWEAFTVRHDNNHILNTLYLHWMGLRDAWIVYRLPSVVAGTATVALVLAAERPGRRTAALFTAALVALSYPLVLYSAEARGYAPALFCALASFYALERHEQTPQRAFLATFWATAVAGMLCHAVYLQAYLALLGWSLLRTRHLPTLVARHGVPLAAAAAFYLFFLRGMVIGGGPVYRTLDVVRDAAAWALGIPTAGTIAVAVVAGVTLAGFAVLFRERSPRWQFFVLVLAVVPTLVLVVTQPPVLYFRYFLVQILFFYLLAGSALAALAHSGTVGRVAALGALAVYAAIQMVPLRALATEGRGGCVETVRYLGAQTRGDTVVVGSDEDFRNPLMLWYFQRFLPAGRQLRHVPQTAWPPAGPEWVLVHDLGPATNRPAAMQDGGGHRYDRVAGFQCGGIARWYWWVYRRSGV